MMKRLAWLSPDPPSRKLNPRITRRKSRGFTLIELLIVVAIIAILAAIAVPNFLEAQVRSKVSRVMADQRSIAVAMESYHIDAKHYPPDWHGWCKAMPGKALPTYLVTVRWCLVPLTTPVAFLTTLPGTSFETKGSRHGGDFDAIKDSGSTYDTAENPSDPYLGFALGGQELRLGASLASIWCLRDVGPDAIWDNTYIVRYDPTNGTVSNGDIFRFGP